MLDSPTSGTTGGDIPDIVVLGTSEEEGGPIVIGVPSQLFTPCNQVISL